MDWRPPGCCAGHGGHAWANRPAYPAKPFAGCACRPWQRPIRPYDGKATARALLISLVFNALQIGWNLAIAQGLGLHLSLMIYLVFVPLTAVALLLPAFGGLGVREMSYVGLFGSVGVPQGVALALSLSVYAITVASGLIGGPLYLAQGVRRARQTNKESARTAKHMTPELSIVIPLYNEEKNVDPLYQELSAALEDLARPYEVIVVDDGSRDGGFECLKAIYQADPHWRVIRFRRNFGQTAGFAAGFAAARGDIVITLDADLQNDPRDIGKLLAKMDEGYDIVSGWRVNRKEPFLSRRMPSMLANRMISGATGIVLHDYGCSLKAYRCEVIKNVNLYGDLHRFIPALASYMGVSIAEVPVNDRARRFGRSKYGLTRTFRVLLDLITVRFILGYATRPLHVFGGLGLLSGGLGILIGMYLTFLKLAVGQNIGSRPLLLLAALLVILGVQMVSMGLLAEMVTRTYYEAQGKSIYVVREVLGPEIGE